MTDCNKYSEMISAYCDGELCESEASELRAHLEVCASCRALFDVYSEISAAAAEDLPEAPRELAENVMAGINKKNAEKKRRRLPARYFALAACLVVIVLASTQLRSLYPQKEVGSAPMAPAESAAEKTEDCAPADCLPESDGIDSDSITSESANNSYGLMSGDSAPTANGSAYSGASSDSVKDPYNESAAAPDPSSAPTERLFMSVVNVTGDLPDVLRDYIDDDTESAEVTVPNSVAEKLIALGYESSVSDPDSSQSLVIYNKNP